MHALSDTACTQQVLPVARHMASHWGPHASENSPFKVVGDEHGPS